MTALARFHRLRNDALDALAAAPPAPTADEPELRILFVCYGNSCRSPLAEGVLRGKLARAGLLGRVVVDSAGTHAGDVDAPPDWRARRVARRHGVPIGDLRARRFEVEDYDRFDRIVVFDRRNRDDVLALAPDASARSRVQLLRGPNAEVADPVAGAAEDFERVYEQIDEACERLLAEFGAALAVS